MYSASISFYLSIVKMFRIRISFVLKAVLGTSLSFLSLLFLYHYYCEMWHLFPIKINYFKLEQFLANKQWMEADRETAIIYKQITRKYLEKEGLYGLFKLDFLGGRQATFFMGDLPCQKLETLDRLWLRYSEGQFGFSVQAQIVESIKSDSHNLDRYEIFKKQVGWDDKYYSTPGFYDSAINPDKARGYLPSSLWMSYSPAPIRIIQPLEKFHSCISTYF